MTTIEDMKAWLYASRLRLAMANIVIEQNLLVLRTYQAVILTRFFGDPYGYPLYIFSSYIYSLNRPLPCILSLPWLLRRHLSPVPSTVHTRIFPLVLNTIGHITSSRALIYRTSLNLLRYTAPAAADSVSTNVIFAHCFVVVCG